jgi:hypothetical protein
MPRIRRYSAAVASMGQFTMLLSRCHRAGGSVLTSPDRVSGEPHASSRGMLDSLKNSAAPAHH